MYTWSHVPMRPLTTSSKCLCIHTACHMNAGFNYMLLVASLYCFFSFSFFTHSRWLSVSFSLSLVDGFFLNLFGVVRTNYWCFDCDMDVFACGYENMNAWVNEWKRIDDDNARRNRLLNHLHMYWFESNTIIVIYTVISTIFMRLRFTEYERTVRVCVLYMNIFFWIQYTLAWSFLIE